MLVLLLSLLWATTGSFAVVNLQSPLICGVSMGYDAAESPNCGYDNAPLEARADYQSALADTWVSDDLVPGFIAANTGGKIYHYTGEANVAGILEKGLVPGRASGKVWTTPNGSLTPTQAQIELALSPNRGLPGAMLEIDAAALQRAGIKPSLGPVRVQPTSNAPGGGLETIFDQAIPPEFIRRAR